MDNQNFQTQGVKKNLPRDLFLHLLAIVTLYWSAISFITLLWQFINNFLPDVAQQYYSQNVSFGLIRFSVSSLFIVFPIFIFVSWYLNKIYKKESVVRESKIRKWLLYLTLFIAAIVVIIDLVTVINTFLEGEATLRFVLKASSVFLVAAFIFGYYLDDVRRDTPAKSGKHFAVVASILVIAGIVSAFFIIGSPATNRLTELDQRKISNLQEIQYQVVNYYQMKGELPKNLDELTDSISGFRAPKDPQSDDDENFVYTYKVISTENLSFELCATFNKEGNERYAQPRQLGGAVETWGHPEGEFCFERTIDKERYPIGKGVIQKEILTPSY